MKRIATANRAVDLFAAGKDGFRQAVAGVSDATYLTALFFNHLQESIVRTIESAGLVLSDTDYDQFVTAIKKLQQTATESYAIDTGVANTYQAAYSPAVSVLADGMVLKFRAKTANTGASTFSPNGLAAAPIWGGDHVAVGGGEIIANGDVWLQWNSALNGGNGAWLLIDSTGGYLKSPTPALFDNSQKLATTGFVQRAIGNMQGGVILGASQVLTAADAGKVFSLNVSASPITLPPFSAVQSGAKISFVNVGSTNVVIQRSGSETLFGPSGVGNQSFSSALTSYTLLPGDSCEFTACAQWEITGGTCLLQSASSFFASKGGQGYQKLPSGLIIQWGTNAPVGGNEVYSWPIAWPNAMLTAQATDTGGTVAIGAVEYISLSQFRLWARDPNNNLGNFIIRWLAIGY